MDTARERRRLRSLLWQLRAPAPASAAPRPGGSAHAAAERPQALKLLDDAAVKSFIMTGWMKISPEEVGLPRAFMQTIYDKMSALHDDTEKKIGENSHSTVPEIHDVMAQPAVAGALQSLLGKDYSLHPHTFTHIKHDVGADQDWVSGPTDSPSGSFAPRASLLTVWLPGRATCCVITGDSTRTVSCLATATASATTSRSMCS